MKRSKKQHYTNYFNILSIYAEWFTNASMYLDSIHEKNKAYTHGSIHRSFGIFWVKSYV